MWKGWLAPFWRGGLAGVGASCSLGILHLIPPWDRQPGLWSVSYPFLPLGGDQGSEARAVSLSWTSLTAYYVPHYGRRAGRDEKAWEPVAGGRAWNPGCRDSKPHRDGRLLGESGAGLILQRREACLMFLEGGWGLVCVCVLGRGTMKAVSTEALG